LTAGSHTLHFDSRPLIMGVLNVTPDSFSDGGAYATKQQAVQRAKDMHAEGADVIDIGAESSRPGSHSVGEAEELRRLLPVLEEVRAAVPIPISVDTTKAAVARQAIQRGASIINDISALGHDPDMAALIADSGAGIVLMHMQGTPETMQRNPTYRDVSAEVSAFLQQRAAYAVTQGIKPTQIMLDPGIGFGKLGEHNLQLLAELDMLTTLGYPILVGVSRKEFIGRLVNQPVHERVYGTAGAVAAAILKGVHMIRVHDVRAMREVALVAAAIAKRSLSHSQVSHA
jgi:dihydropteroate synthase